MKTCIEKYDKYCIEVYYNIEVLLTLMLAISPHVLKPTMGNDGPRTKRPRGGA